MAQWYFLHRPGRVTVFVLNKDIALKNVLLRRLFMEKGGGAAFVYYFFLNTLSEKDASFFYFRYLCAYLISKLYENNTFATRYFMGESGN